MMTLHRFTDRPPDVPMSAAWYLADLGEAKGRQELFIRQLPQRLKALREHALIESAVSSNRIEGVEIDASRVHAVVLGRPALRDRNEEEVRGYRDALKLIHGSGSRLAVSEKAILDLHSLSRGGVGDAGQYKQRDIDIIETYPDGRSRVRFKTVPAERTRAAMSELVSGWNGALEDRRLHPLLAVPLSTSTSCAFIRSATATAESLACSCSSSAITSASRWAATSASNASSSRTRTVITRLWNSPPRAGTKASTIPGPIWAICCSFSKRPIVSSRIASGRSRRREERRARSSSTPSARRPMTSASPTSSANVQESAST
jgi:hypothetical protein